LRTLKLTLAYDGAEFSGWQVQPGRATVQGLLREALARITGAPAELPQGSGRTDAGVHALAQVASWHTDSPIPAANLAKALNDVLPPAIRVVAAQDAAADFHARLSARRKTYRYRIHRGALCPPHRARYIYHHPFPLDEPAMIAAAAIVAGEHDFTSFAAMDPERHDRLSASAADEDEPEAGKITNIRTIYESRWERVRPVETGHAPSLLESDTFCARDELIYTVTGNGFLHHMVRNLVGTFLLIGKGTLTHADLRRILELRDRSAAGPTAPASGLWLVAVEY
jgi:tRNA pseudouridine38-40 synthase